MKEAVHIKTGKYYACKVINKKLMEGREYMVSTTTPDLRPSSRLPLFALPVRCRTQPNVEGRRFAGDRVPARVCVEATTTLRSVLGTLGRTARSRESIAAICHSPNATSYTPYFIRAASTIALAAAPSSDRYRPVNP